LQFHVEVDESAVAAFLETFGQDAERAGRDPQTIAAATPLAVRDLEPFRRTAFRSFTDLVWERSAPASLVVDETAAAFS